MQDLTLKETAKILSISYGHIYALCRKGKFPAYKVGSLWRVNPDDLNLYRKGKYQTSVHNNEENPCQSLNVVKFTMSDSASREKQFTEALNKARAK